MVARSSCSVEQPELDLLELELLELELLVLIELLLLLLEELELLVLMEDLLLDELEKVLGIGAVRTSQQLAYLRRHQMVEVEIRGTWRVYSPWGPFMQTIGASSAVTRSGLLVILRTPLPWASRAWFSGWVMNERRSRDNWT